MATDTKLRLKDYIGTISEKAERRYFHEPMAFLEVEENGAKVKDENQITGYAAVFNRDSENFGSFVEQIDSRAFDGVIDDDTWGYLNHSRNFPLGRNKVNIKLSIDDVGLRYTIKLPDTTVGRDVRELVKLGIIYKSSFAFIAAEERMVKGDPSKDIPHKRIITKMERLIDVSPLSTDPAYPDTTVAARGFKLMEAKEEIQRSLTELSYIYHRQKFNLKKQLNKK